MFIDKLPKLDKTLYFYNKNKDNFNNPFYKTEMCKFGLQCQNLNCNFAHSISEKKHFYHPSELTTIDFNWRIKMCRNENLCLNSNCQYAHCKEELRKIPCKFQSFCKNIEKCPYAHYFQEPNMMITEESLKNTSLAFTKKNKLDSIENELIIMIKKINILEEKNNSFYNQLESIKNEYILLEKEMNEELKIFDEIINEIDLN